MKNRDDAAVIESEQGRAKYAAAVASGLNAYLSQRV
jgi:N-acetylmuramoyl-L-alanine amidase